MEQELMVKFTGIIAFATVAYVIISFWLLYLTKRSVDKMRDAFRFQLMHYYLQITLRGRYLDEKEVNEGKIKLFKKMFPKDFTGFEEGKVLQGFQHQNREKSE